MKKLIVLATVILAMGLTSALKAQSATPKASTRQVKQQARIHQGVANGELTRKEAAGLQMQQASVQRHKRAAKADGVVTPRERRSINRHQNRASRNIAHQKNDGQNRY
jgi:hypothetical protein